MTPEDREMLDRWAPDLHEQMQDWFDARDRIAEWGSVTPESVPQEAVERKLNGN